MAWELSGVSYWWYKFDTKGKDFGCWNAEKIRISNLTEISRAYQKGAMTVYCVPSD